MVFTLEAVVPWGRELEEYVDMFCLTRDDLSCSILGCGDGPASFNKEATERGHRVTSCDPIYQFSADEIASRIHAVYDTILRQLHENRKNYLWDKIESPEELGDLRMFAMQQFLGDYARGREDRRYVFASLPALPFRDKEFDLALVSHLLFTYSDHLSFDFHLFSITELCRVAKEVRIFPLLDISGTKSVHVEPTASAMKHKGYKVEFLITPYEFQKGAHTMLRILP